MAVASNYSNNSTSLQLCNAFKAETFKTTTNIVVERLHGTSLESDLFILTPGIAYTEYGISLPENLAQNKVMSLRIFQSLAAPTKALTHSS